MNKKELIEILEKVMFIYKTYSGLEDLRVLVKLLKEIIIILHKKISALSKIEERKEEDNIIYYDFNNK